MSELPETRSYSGPSILIAAVVGVAVAVLSIWWAAGFGPFYEVLFRIQPTVAGGGVGADFVAGNELGSLKFLIFAIHLADFVMGMFILAMVFVHWAAFRRLAARMRQPGNAGEAVTDGGENR
ncbi:hypothetical protein [Natronomonas sp. EA1]|uniref:hypothetical protein n=1 Tax=Natronomonas sp. EA1 TaxID=3421655 RepID=UPI003EBE0400